MVKMTLLNDDLNAKLVYHLVSLIPRGKVLTYGTISKILPIKSPRLIGKILHHNQDSKNIPCHRVVFADGRLSNNYAFGGLEKQYQRLKREGVRLFINNGYSGNKIKVDLKANLWSINDVLKTYFFLLKTLGFPGPWPWFGSGAVATKEEIIIESILTQNTSWENVKKAMSNLKKERLNTLSSIYVFGRKNLEALKNLVRPAGCYHQKGIRLFLLTKFIIENYNNLENFGRLSLEKAREELLKQRGVGKETADTILLYALEKPVFVIDKYTQRFAERYFLDSFKKEPHFKKVIKSYDLLQDFFMSNLPTDVSLFKNYHALIVEWGKKVNFRPKTLRLRHKRLRAFSDLRAKGK